MAIPAIHQFNLRPAVVERYHPENGSEVWVAPYIVLWSDEGRVEVPGEVESRTLGVETVLLDSPEEAHWTVGGTHCVARAIRPYDGVLLGISDHPMVPDEIEELVLGSHGYEPTVHGVGCKLDLDPDKVFVDEVTQRQRAADTAASIKYDLDGEDQIPDWRLHVPKGHLGWAPTKVPLVRRELSPTNTRFVTPAIAELMWQGALTAKDWTREHIVARSLINDECRAAGNMEELAQIVWDYRFAVVLVTRNEDRRIGQAGKVGRWERYIAAGVFSVYDRLTRRDIPVAAVDPRSEKGTLLDAPG